MALGLHVHSGGALREIFVKSHPLFSYIYFYKPVFYLTSCLYSMYIQMRIIVLLFAITWNISVNIICFTLFRMSSTQAGQSTVVHRLATLLRNNGIESVFNLYYCLFQLFHQALFLKNMHTAKNVTKKLSTEICKIWIE